jgi:hypothetical protein
MGGDGWFIQGVRKILDGTDKPEERKKREQGDVPIEEGISVVYTKERRTTCPPLLK